MLAKPNCKKFINGVLEELGRLPNGVFNLDLMNIFEAVRVAPNGGFFSDPSLLPRGLANAGGSISAGTAEITFGIISAKVAIHELFHVAAAKGLSIYSHDAIGQAANASAKAMKLHVLADLPKIENYKTPGDFDLAMNGYITQALFDACVRDVPWEPPH